ncbi:MAG: N-acetylmuramoyl-L-alanine amidase [Candidatus Cryptobacteroides sp.]
MKRITALLFTIIVLSLQSLAADKLGLKTIVIDAGHGGKDPGAVSKDNKTYEKTFTLDIAKRLAKKIRKTYPDVKVVLTRDSDVFISLDERAQIANRNNADLFISIHINSASSTKSNGYSTHVLGQSSKKNTDLYKANLELVKRENAVIKLDENYQTSQSGFDPSDPSSFIFMTMMQSAHLEQSINLAQMINTALAGGPIRNDRGVSQDPFYVLWKTTMPAVLVELGFISNENDLAQLKQEKKRDELADKLLLAFGNYKRYYDSSMDLSGINTSHSLTPQPIEKTEEILYGVQIFTLSKSISSKDARLLGYKPMVFDSGKYKRYVIAVNASKDECRKAYENIKKKYPDSFMVKIKGEKVERIK